MERLRNPVREYAWGSRSVIAALQGRPVPSPGPEAELWIGAHPGDPSRLARSGAPLPEVIAAAPVQVLGAEGAARFGPRLPYLLKLLAADAPLSLQAHPDSAQASAGYAAEEAAGVARDAPYRRYLDPYHKPELLVAVSEFHALCGFREPAESAELLAGLGVPALDPVVAALAAGDLAGAVRWLLRRPDPGPLVAEVTAAAARGGAGAGYALVGELAAAYPGDVGVVVALLLNRVTLAPGEAIFMPAGNLHTYLHGTGVEIMAASDNVLRGGLTPKHVDVPELLRVLRFDVLPDPVVPATAVSPGVVSWPVPVAEFTLHRVRLAGDEPGGVREAQVPVSGPRIVLCLAGEVGVDEGHRAGAGGVPAGNGDVAMVTLGPGGAAFAGAGTGRLRLTGDGEAYVASMGTHSY